MSENKKNVLHVEDDTDLRGYVSAIIGDKVNITNATSLKEAYETLASNKFDLILLDLTLPDGSGMDILNTLDNIEGDIPPVVIFSMHEVTDSLPHVTKVLVKGRYNEVNFSKTITELLNIDS